MGAAGVRVTCSGAVLSTLLYEQLRKGHPQEGFLLGTVDSHISEHISDSQICNEKMETAINVSSFLPCTMIGSFYSGTGELSNEKLSGYLGSSFQHVIGWYRCRGSFKNLYMREMLVHEQLSKIMSHTGGHFVLGILSCSASNDNGTFTVSHKFMMGQNGNFKGIALHVLNMGDTSTDEYRLRPRNPALYKSSAIIGILSNINNCEPGVSEAEELHTGLLQKLDHLLPKFSHAEKDLEKVLQEVASLRILCGNNGIPIDFTPETHCMDNDQNLMDFEETLSPASQSSKGKSSPKKGSVKKGASPKNKNTIEEKSSSDPFGFVHKEMEKLQVKGKGSPTKWVSRSRTNTPSPGRITNKSKPGGARIERTPPKNNILDSLGSNEESSSALEKRSKNNNSGVMGKDSQEGAGRGRAKGGRPLSRTTSTERNSPSRVTRSQSPAVGSSRGNRSGKKREAWSEKSDSGSQEY